MHGKDILPKYPLFIPTKGRWESRYTIKALERIGLSYRAVVEPQEYDKYNEYIDSENLIKLPHSNKGLVITRNWIWDYAVSQGHEKFWTFDDNIESFWRWNKNSKVKVETPTFLRAIEDFSDRYTNAPIVGMQYFMFVRSRYLDTPFRLNTRVYSNMLIQANIPYRNRGFYNDDTDLCLRILMDGYCTILFNAFLIKKRVTMTTTGGMTPYYTGDGRLKMAQELQQRFPDIVKITRKWGRWQHQVDYRPFKGNKLIRKRGVVIPDTPNEYGMKLVKKED
jgi:hypothetical protein